MRIKTLTLENFRGISDLKIDFHDNMNILVGVNGSGKSSILDALSILLSQFTNTIHPKNRFKHGLQENDITNKVPSAELNVCIYYANQSYEWATRRDRKKRKIRRTLFNSNKHLLIEEIHKEMELSDQFSLPLTIYYPVTRAVIDIPLRIRTKHEFNQFSAYEQALSGKTIDFRSFFEWFREQEDIENEMRLHKEELFDWKEENIFNYRDPLLQAVRKAIHKLLPEFDHLRVRRSPLRMTIQKGREELIINQLSDGEKCLIAMVGDLARRLALANPSLENKLEGKGIVLIDEIELHLHPGWQRMIIPALEKIFINCQFIVTTHSPQILSHVESEKIFMLERKKNNVVVSHPEDSYGLDSNRILEDILGVPERPAEIKNDLGQLFDRIDRGELEAAQHHLTELHEKIGNDPELLKADILIKRKELLHK